MKKIPKLILVLVILFGYIPNVFASTVTWKQITDKWEAIPKDRLAATITATDTNLKIEDDNSDYEINFSYNNGTITMVKSNPSSITEDTLGVYEFTNIIMLSYMVEIISELYDVDMTQIDPEEAEDYGISLTTSEYEYTSEDENSTISFSGKSVDTFSINLNTFEETTRELQGTYNEKEETPLTLETTEPKVKLVLGKSYSDSLDLIVNIEDLPEDSTAKCEIYLIPDEDTAFSNGESHVIGTINNCKNGNNTYKVTGLKENSKYTFQVVMTEELSLGMTNQVLGEKYVTFATITKAVEQNDKNISIDTTGNVLTNPQTGTIAFIITIISAIISATAFILLYLKNRKKCEEI